jgi:hypothetical protein
LSGVPRRDVRAEDVAIRATRAPSRSPFRIITEFRRSLSGRSGLRDAGQKLLVHARLW